MSQIDEALSAFGMTYAAVPPPMPVRPLLPEQALIAEVIKLAIEEAAPFGTLTKEKRKLRDAAIKWLSNPHGTLATYCAMLDLDPRPFARWAQGLHDGTTSRPKMCRAMLHTKEYVGECRICLLSPNGAHVQRHSVQRMVAA